MSDARRRVSFVAPIGRSVDVGSDRSPRMVRANDSGPSGEGRYASGVSRTADPPLEWSETKNIRWKIEIPGRGSSSPVVWGNRLFCSRPRSRWASTGAAAHEPRSAMQPRDVHRSIVLGIDRRTGRVMWEDRPRGAAAGAVNEGWNVGVELGDHRRQRVFAFFDSSGLYAYDMEGTLLWEKHLGDKQMFAEVGESGSTPVLFGNRLVVVWDHQGYSFIVALNARTGAELWRSSGRRWTGGGRRS